MSAKITKDKMDFISDQIKKRENLNFKFTLYVDLLDTIE